MKITYDQNTSIPFYAQFFNSASGESVAVSFPYDAGTSLTSATGGSVYYSVFDYKTNNISLTTLNGIPLSLTGIPATLLSASGNVCLGEITSGLTGSANGTGYTVVFQYVYENPINFLQATAQTRTDFWIYSNVNDLPLP